MIKVKVKNRELFGIDRHQRELHKKCRWTRKKVRQKRRQVVASKFTSKSNTSRRSLLLLANCCISCHNIRKYSGSMKMGKTTRHRKSLTIPRLTTCLAVPQTPTFISHPCFQSFCPPKLRPFFFGNHTCKSLQKVREFVVD